MTRKTPKASKPTRDPERELRRIERHCIARYKKGVQKIIALNRVMDDALREVLGTP